MKFHKILETRLNAPSGRTAKAMKLQNYVTA